MTFARASRRHLMRAAGAALVGGALLAGPLPAGAEPPPTQAAPPSMAVLRTELQRLVAATTAGGEYAVAVTDLQTGETVSVHGDRPHLAACSINLVLLMQVVLDVQAGRTRERDVATLIAQTIYSSNPVTARSLYLIVGSGDVLRGVRRTGALIERLGMGGTILDHPPGYGRESVGLDRNNWMTALDTNVALQALWDGEVLEPRWRDDLLDRLTEVKPGLNYLTAVVPGEVSHKNGFFQASDGTYVDNDAAIVRFTHNGQTYAYAISFFSQWVPKKYADIPLGQSLAHTTWAFFQTRYGEAE